MAVKIRLQRRGRKKQPFYHIIVADARAPRDGRFIEKLGIYNPLSKPATIDLDRDRAFDWLMKGAIPTETARAILRLKGVLYRKHLARGVAKGALTQEEADSKYADWIAEKESYVAKRKASTEEEKAAYHARVSGTPKPVEPTVVPVDEEQAAEPVAAEPVAAEPETAEPETADLAEVADQVEAPDAVSTPEAPAGESDENTSQPENSAEDTTVVVDTEADEVAEEGDTAATEEKQ